MVIVIHLLLLGSTTASRHGFALNFSARLLRGAGSGSGGSGGSATTTTLTTLAGWLASSWLQQLFWQLLQVACVT